MGDETNGQVDETAAPEDAAAPQASEPPAAAAAPDADALLSMFQTSQAEGEDRAVLLDLAGSPEIDDLLEELATIAAALGLTADQSASRDSFEQRAA